MKGNGILTKLPGYNTYVLYGIRCSTLSHSNISLGRKDTHKYASQITFTTDRCSL